MVYCILLIKRLQDILSSLLSYVALWFFFTHLLESSSTLRPKDEAEYNDDIAQQEEYLHPQEDTMSSSRVACLVLTL